MDGGPLVPAAGGTELWEVLAGVELVDLEVFGHFESVSEMMMRQIARQVPMTLAKSVQAQNASLPMDKIVPAACTPGRTSTTLYILTVV